MTKIRVKITWSISIIVYSSVLLVSSVPGGKAVLIDYHHAYGNLTWSIV